MSTNNSLYRCPAGSHLLQQQQQEQRQEMVYESDMTSTTATASTTKKDISNSTINAVTNTVIVQQMQVQQQQVQLSDLANAATAEQIRLEARKNHKRYMDAIYARRRRKRERNDEKELIREAERVQRLNSTLQSEHRRLQSLMQNVQVQFATTKNDIDQQWLHKILSSTTTPTTAVTESGNDSEITERKQSSSRVPSVPSVSASTASALLIKKQLQSPNCSSVPPNSHRKRQRLTSNNGTSSSSSKPHPASSQCDTTTIDGENEKEKSRVSNANNGDSKQHRLKSQAIAASSSSNGSSTAATFQKNDHRLNEEQERTIQAIRQASYLQGIQDAALLANNNNTVMNHQNSHRHREGSTHLTSAINVGSSPNLLHQHSRYNLTDLERLLLLERRYEQQQLPTTPTNYTELLLSAATTGDYRNISNIDMSNILGQNRPSILGIDHPASLLDSIVGSDSCDPSIGTRSISNTNSSTSSALDALIALQRSSHRQSRIPSSTIPQQQTPHELLQRHLMLSAPQMPSSLSRLLNTYENNVNMNHQPNDYYLDLLLRQQQAPPPSSTAPIRDAISTPSSSLFYEQLRLQQQQQHEQQASPSPKNAR